MTISEYNQRYETVIHSNLSDREKTMKLSNLMTELELAFNIPMQRKPEWEEKNRPVIALYRKIANSRKL